MSQKNNFFLLSRILVVRLRGVREEQIALLMSLSGCYGHRVAWHLENTGENGLGFRPINLDTLLTKLAGLVAENIEELWPHILDHLGVIPGCALSHSRSIDSRHYQGGYIPGEGHKPRYPNLDQLDTWSDKILLKL